MSNGLVAPWMVVQGPVILSADWSTWDGLLLFQEIRNPPPLGVTLTTGWIGTIMERSTRRPVGPAGEPLLILKSSVLGPAMRPFAPVIVKGTNPSKLGLVIPVLLPFTRMSTPVLSTAHLPTILTKLTSYPVRSGKV